VSDDLYVYPGTKVLRNALDIRDGERLQRVEANLTRLRLARLAAERLPGRYDLAHLQVFHRILFEGLYEWAGELRSVRLAKDDMFCLPEHIESYAGEIFGHLAGEGHLAGLGREAFVERLAHYLGEVNAVHPFREGNGRTQRAFFSQVAADAGYLLDWGQVDPERNVQASIAAMRGDERPLRDLLADAARPTDAPRHKPARES
jgi:cell filamentation protein